MQGSRISTLFHLFLELLPFCNNFAGSVTQWLLKRYWLENLWVVIWLWREVQRALFITNLSICRVIALQIESTRYSTCKWGSFKEIRSKNDNIIICFCLGKCHFRALKKVIFYNDLLMRRLPPNCPWCSNGNRSCLFFPEKQKRKKNITGPSDSLVHKNVIRTHKFQEKWFIITFVKLGFFFQ